MDSLALLSGAVFDNKFVILSSLGAGGMGAVYKAKQIGFERIVALKLLNNVLVDFGDSEARFEREAKILSMLEHVNIAKFFVYGVSADHIPYLALEYVDGQSLRKRLSEEQKLPWRTAVSLTMQICNALSYAHKQAVIHRDLKPDNIMLDVSSDAERVVLIDFGLSKLSDPQMSEVQKLTRTGDLIGSVNYLSPELCKGLKPDARSDIYAVGVILYEAISGILPFTADTPIGVIFKHANEQAEPLNIEALTIPVQLRQIIERAIAKNVDERYQSADELKADLQALSENRLDQINVRSESTGRLPKRILLLLLSVMLIACLIAGFTLMSSSLKHSNPDLVLEENKHNDGSSLHSVQGLSLMKIAELEPHVASLLSRYKGVEAETSARKWIAEHKKLGPLSPSEIAISATVLGSAQTSLGDHDDALETYENALSQLDGMAGATAQDRFKVLRAIVAEAGYLGRKAKVEIAESRIQEISKDPGLTPEVLENVRLNIVFCKVSRHKYVDALQYMNENCKEATDQKSFQRQRAICLFLLNRVEEGKAMSLAYAGVKPNHNLNTQRKDAENNVENIRAAHQAASCAEFTSHFDSAIELLAPALQGSPLLVDEDRATALADLANWKVMHFAGKGRNKGEILDRKTNRVAWERTLKESIAAASEAAAIFGKQGNGREQFRALAKVAFFHSLLDDEASYKQTIDQIYAGFKPGSKPTVDRWLSSQMYAHATIAFASGWSQEAMRLFKNVERLYVAMGNEAMAKRCRTYFLKAEKLSEKENLKKVKAKRKK